MAKEASSDKFITLSKVETFLIALGVILIFTTFPHGIGGDAVERFHSLQQLLEKGLLTDSKYSYIGPLFSVPLYLLGSWINSPGYWVARFNPVVFSFYLYFMFQSLKNFIPIEVLRKFSLLIIVASLFPKHLKEFYAEIFTATLVSWSLLQFALGRHKIIAPILFCLGTANTPAMLIGSAGALIARVWQTKKFRSFFLLAPCLAVIFLENYFRRGGFFSTGYEKDLMVKTILPYSGISGFSYPIFFGLLSNLFSFGKGLIWFTPALFLPLSKSRVPEKIWNAYCLWISCVAGLLLIYSKWSAWYAGWFWGPRFFLIASIPAALSLAYHLAYPSKKTWMNLLVLAILSLSVWVGVNGVVFDQHGLTQCNYDMEMLCWYVPEFSALWNPFVENQQLHSHQRIILVYFFLTSIVMCLDFIRSSQLPDDLLSFARRSWNSVLQFRW